MKFDTLPLLVLSSVGEYFGYCCPLLTLHSSPSSALLAHAFARILPHVNNFQINSDCVWYLADSFELYIYAGENAGFEIYNERLYNNIPLEKNSFRVRKADKANFRYFLEHGEGHIEAPVIISVDELEAVASSCNRLVEELNSLKTKKKLRSLLGPQYLTKGQNEEVRWFISLVQDDQPIGKIDVTIEERKGPRGDMFLEMRIGMASSINEFTIIFRSNSLPFIWGNGRDIRSVDIPDSFNEVIIQEIHNWFADLQKYMEQTMKKN